MALWLEVATGAMATPYACAVARRAQEEGAKRPRLPQERVSSKHEANSAGTARATTRKTAQARRPAEPPELRRAIGERLASVRREGGQTQEQVSERAGRRKSWLAKIERGQRSMLFSEAVQLAGLLNVPLDDLWPQNSNLDTDPGEIGAARSTRRS